MRKLLKFLIYLVLTVVVLVVIAVGSILLFVDPNQFKPQITELAKKHGNVVLKIEGDIQWTFFPWLGLEVDGIHVASPNSPTLPFALIKHVKASVLVKSLLDGNLSVSDVVLDGLVVNLLKDAKGNTNWKIVVPSKGPVNVNNSEDQITNIDLAEAKSKKEMELYIKSISVTNASFAYKDALENQLLVLQIHQLKTGEIAVGQPISMNMDSEYALFAPKLKGTLKLSTVIGFDSKAKRLRLNNFNMNNSIDIDQQLHLLTNISTDLDMDLNSEMLQLSGLKVSLNGKVGDFVLDDINLTGEVKADIGHEVISLNNFVIEDKMLKVNADFLVENFTNDDLKFNAKLTSNEFNLKQLLSSYQVLLPDFEQNKVMTKASIMLNANGTKKNIDINQLILAFDQTKMVGTAQLAFESRPTVAIVLKGDQVDINNYRVKSNEAQKMVNNKTTSTQHSSSNTDLIPLLPKDIDLLADVSLDSLKLDDLSMTQNHIKASLKSGDVVLEKFFTNVYGGTIDVVGFIMGSKPSVSINGGIKNIDLSKVMPKINLQSYITNTHLLGSINKNHQDLSVQGLLNANFAITTVGRKQDQITANLNGNANFELSNGRISNFNYEKLMCQGIALLNQKKLSTPLDKNYTDFQRLSGDFVLHNGVLTNNSLSIIVPGVNISGQGAVNLNRMTIDYRAKALLTGDQSINPDPACQINDNFKGIALPIRCEGSLSDAQDLCGLDQQALGGIIQNLVERKVEEKIDKELNKQKDRLNNKVNEKLNKQLDKSPVIKGVLKNIL